MRVLLLLLLSLFVLPALAADNLLRWHDAQHFMVPLRRLKPNAHGNCARFIPA